MKKYILGLLIFLTQICLGQTGTYQYDGNGNVIADSYNNIAFIQYDINNLPITVYKTDGTKIEYSYNTNGERVRKTVGSANTYYIQGADGQTEAIANDDPTKTVFNIDKIGRAERQGSTWIRSYYLKDHLGTIRMTLADNGSIISYDDYYAFGLYMPGRSGRIGDAAGRYKFTGKERDVETGFDYFGARYYDSRIGRWMAVDPLAEMYPRWSPYNYTFDNPLRFIDPNGMGNEDEIKRRQQANANFAKASESAQKATKAAGNSVEGSVSTGLGVGIGIRGKNFNASLTVGATATVSSNLAGELSSVISVGFKAKTEVKEIVKVEAKSGGYELSSQTGVQKQNPSISVTAGDNNYSVTLGSGGTPTVSTGPVDWSASNNNDFVVSFSGAVGPIGGEININISEGFRAVKNAIGTIGHTVFGAYLTNSVGGSNLPRTVEVDD